MITPFNLPDHLNPDFMRGYVEGYEAAEVDVLKEIENLRAVSECTSTVSNESSGLADLPTD